MLQGFHEIIRWAGKTSWPGVKVVLFPGLMLQKLTTREPDDDQLEVAIRAFVEAAGNTGEVDDEAGYDGNPEERMYNSKR